MKYNIITVVKNKSKKMLISLVMLAYFFAPLQASPNTRNYAEMATALATIPLDMAAKSQDLKNNTKRAALFYVAADVMSIANKVLFAYNSIETQQWHAHVRDVRRDFVVNGAWMVRDITNLFIHVKEFLSGKSAAADFVQVDDFDFSVVAQSNVNTNSAATGAFDVQTISNFAYAWQVFGLPSLKGLTAFALAWSHNGITEYSGQHARFVATAAHSFVRLSEEYTVLKPGSSYEKILQAALFANFVWLIYEIKCYVLERQRLAAEERRRVGERRVADADKERRRADERRVADAAEERRRVGERRVADERPDEQRAQEVRAAVVARLEAERAALPVLVRVRGRGNCFMCMDDDAEQVVLGCGHATGCRGCSPRLVDAALANDPIDRIRCPYHHAGCAHLMTRNEIQALTNNNVDRLRLFDARQLERAFLATPEGAAIERLRLAEVERARALSQGLVRDDLRVLGGMECPRCHNGVVRIGGCLRMLCRCNFKFCYRCGLDWDQTGGYGGHERCPRPPREGYTGALFGLR